MKLNRILCPIDYSSFSTAANYYASIFAQAVEAEIIFLIVADPSSNAPNHDDKLDDLYMELSNKIRPYIHDLRYEFEVRDGNPAKEIVAVAEERNVDLIVMGTHGRTGASHMLHGSVCAKVLRHASCPVMAVKSEINLDWILPSDAGPSEVDNDEAR